MIDFDNLYKVYSKDVYRFALFLSGDLAVAEDITAETFTRALTNISSIRQSTVKSYLFAIARNYFLETKRTEQRTENIDEVRLGETEMDLTNNSRLVEMSGLLNQLNNLSIDARTALLLRANGLSYQEIAQVMNKNEGLVKTTVHRARRQLLKLSDNKD